MPNYQQLSLFKEKKEELSKLLHESSVIIDELSMPQFAERLKQLSQKVSNDSFKVQIVGTFKNGKSTFINALLGEDILPHRVLPCTAVVNEVKYGEEKHAVLHFCNPLPEKLLDSIPEPTMAHMQAYGMKDVPPMEIEYDHIDKYVTIPVDGDPDEISAMSPYKALELYYPSPLLKEGVEIVDSPGLNENDERTRVTLEYLDKADAVIYLLDACRACAQDEIDTIESILIPKGFKEMFFVVNRIDLVPERERPDVQRFVEKKVGDYSPNAVYCISALKGMEGKIEKDVEKYNVSGMEPFELRLTEFLTQEKGRIKLAQPARELNNILSKEMLFRQIPNQRMLLSTSLNTLKSRYEVIKPQIDDLEERKKDLQHQMMLKIERSEKEVGRAVESFYRDVARRIPVWLQNYQPKTGMGFATKKKLRSTADEMIAFISEKVKELYTEWNKESLKPLIEDKTVYIFDSTDKDLGAIFNTIDDINSQISGIPVPVSGASGWERAAGFATMMFAAAGTGTSIMVNGFKGNVKELAKTFAIDLGVGAGILLLGITNPVIAIGLLISVIWNAFRQGGNAALNGLKNQVGGTICKSIRDGATGKADEIVGEMHKELTKIADSVISVIDIQIESLNSQLKPIIADMEKGKKHVDGRIETINRCEKNLQVICNKLDTLVFDLAGLKASTE